MFEHPEFGTYLGLPTGNDRWTDNSVAAHERRERDSERALEVLKSIDRDELEGVDRLNYDLLLQDMEEDMEGQRFQGEYMAITQMNGVQQNVAQLLAMMPARNKKQYEDILCPSRGSADGCRQHHGVVGEGVGDGHHTSQGDSSRCAPTGPESTGGRSHDQPHAAGLY